MTSPVQLIRCVTRSVLLVSLTCSSGCLSGSGEVHRASRGPSPLRGSKGVPWSILCLEIPGDYREDHIAQLAETLKRTPGIRTDNVFVMHDRDGYSRLYHGRYHRRVDRQTGKRSIPKKMATDLALLKELGIGPEQMLFAGATLVPMPMPDVGNPQWALDKAEGIFSLQVGVFEQAGDFWQFKQAAAEYCALIRKKGFEAYYHHARASSMVTVGCFGAEAVIPQDRGLPRYSSKVVQLQQSDDLMKYNRLNGRIYRARDQSGNMVRVHSRLVHIPRSEQSQP